MNPPLPRIDRKSALPLLGLAMAYPSAGALERIGPDWDWVWIDLQHGDLDLREMTDLVRTCDFIGKPGLVRVPAQDPGWVSRALDSGAAGVIVPMVESLEEARAMVRAAKFPPLGNRSYGGRRVIDRLGRGYYKAANEDMVLILQVESNEAVALSDALAALPGVDGLFLGPDDLTIREGRDVDSPKDAATIGRQARHVADCCRRHGKLSVCVGAGDAAMALAKECGYRLVVGGGDVGFLAGGSKAASQKARAFFAPKA